MSAATHKNEILLVANDPQLYEAGGGHAAKGLDFQRYWAVLRMLELKRTGAPFLLLFESVQDVTELDSAFAPTRVIVYQIKKKDSGTWTWSALTGTTEPIGAGKPKYRKNSTKSTKSPFASTGSSPLVKLCQSVAAFVHLPTEGCFVSNAGCGLPLATGGTAANAVACSLADLDSAYFKLFSDALAHVLPGASTLELSKVRLAKVKMHPDDPASPVIAAALELIAARSPDHAAQASAFVEALIMKVSPLGRRTDACSSFDDLVRERGFSSGDFDAALAALQAVPNRLSLLSLWLTELQQQGLDFLTVGMIRSYAASIAQESLIGVTAAGKEIDNFCDAWIASNDPAPGLRPYCESGVAALVGAFVGRRYEEMFARFLMRAINKCVVQSLDGSSVV